GPIQIAQIPFLGGDLMQAAGYAQTVGLRSPSNCQPSPIALRRFAETALVFEALAEGFPEKYPCTIAPDRASRLVKGLMGSRPVADLPPDLTDAQQQPAPYRIVLLTRDLPGQLPPVGDSFDQLLPVDLELALLIERSLLRGKHWASSRPTAPLGVEVNVPLSRSYVPGSPLTPSFTAQDHRTPVRLLDFKPHPVERGSKNTLRRLWIRRR